MGTTPSQTVGPFFAIELPFGDGPYVVHEGTEDAIWLRGRVLDGAGDPVPDAVLEAWQEAGWGRAHTDADGRWSLRIASADAVVVAVFARGLLNRVVARLQGGGEHDIHLQGERETSFHAV